MCTDHEEQDKTLKYSLIPHRTSHQTDSGMFAFLASWKVKMKRLRTDYTAHHIPSHPHTSQNRDGRSLTHNEQCNPESHTLIPSATMALVVLVMQPKNQSYPLLFLNRGGCCVGAFRRIYQQKSHGWMDWYMQVDSSLEQIRACVSCDNDAALG